MRCTDSQYSVAVLFSFVICLFILRRLFVLLVVFCYAAIAPLLLPVACLLYMGAYLVYRNQSLYVYVQTAESGGAVSKRYVSFVPGGVLLALRHFAAVVGEES